MTEAQPDLSARWFRKPRALFVCGTVIGVATFSVAAETVALIPIVASVPTARMSSEMLRSAAAATIISRPLTIPESRLDLCLIPPNRSPNAAERWEAFEQEFGIDEPHPFPFLRPVERTKYRLDSALFAVDDVLNCIEDALEVEISQGQIHQKTHRIAESPLHRGMFGNVRLKVDVKPLQSYLGVRMIVKFGN